MLTEMHRPRFWHFWPVKFALVSLTNHMPCFSLILSPKSIAHNFVVSLTQFKINHYIIHTTHHILHIVHLSSVRTNNALLLDYA